MYSMVHIVLEEVHSWCSHLVCSVAATLRPPPWWTAVCSCFWRSLLPPWATLMSQEQILQKVYDGPFLETLAHGKLMKCACLPRFLRARPGVNTWRVAWRRSINGASYTCSTAHAGTQHFFTVTAGAIPIHCWSLTLRILYVRRVTPYACAEIRLFVDHCSNPSEFTCSVYLGDAGSQNEGRVSTPACCS